MSNDIIPCDDAGVAQRISTRQSLIAAKQAKLSYNEAIKWVVYVPETGYFFMNKDTPKRSAGDRAEIPHNGYLAIRINGLDYLAHRLAFLIMDKEWPSSEIQVDHINGIKDDNRRSNLRLVSCSYNQLNQKGPRIDNRSGYQGVHWCASRSKWKSQIKINGVIYTLGYFDNVDEAGQKYQDANREYWENGNVPSITKKHSRTQSPQQSKEKGVFWNKRRRKWEVVLYVDSKRQRMGVFVDKQEAESVCRAARIRLMEHGE